MSITSQRLRFVHADPHLTLNGHYIAVRPTFKLLGIVFDCKLERLEDHIDNLVIRCRKVLNLTKCMARIRWGADREILIRIYQAIIESRLSYASPVSYTALLDVAKSKNWNGFNWQLYGQPQGLFEPVDSRSIV
nr:unnamed protein product [Callosobruchus chinensis]